MATQPSLARSTAQTVTEWPDAAHSLPTEASRSALAALTARIGDLASIIWSGTCWVLMLWRDADHTDLVASAPATRADIEAASDAEDWARLVELLGSPDPDAVTHGQWVLYRHALGEPRDHGRWIYEAERCGERPPTVHSLPSYMTPSEWLEELTGEEVVAPVDPGGVLRYPDVDELLDLSGEPIPF